MAATYAPSKLIFTGADQYKAADLTAVTGLTPGKQVTTEEVDAAMQKLVDTGLFSDMRYTVDGQALTFMLTSVPADQLLAARYKNLVWWTDGELTTLVAKRVPLFTGAVPVTGTMKESVASALTELVASKSVKASITSVNSAGNLGGRVSELLFSIENPMVEVGEVKIDEVSSNAAASVATVKKRFTGEDYNAYSSAASLRQNLKDAYLDLGYLDVAIDVPVTGFPRVSEKEILIPLTAAAHEGAVYHVSRLEWPESTILSKAAFTEASQVKAGDLASRIVLLRTELAESARFRAVGYLEAKVSSKGTKDEAKHEIAYAFDAVPGEQYKLASVKTPGLNADQQAEFDRAWKLAPGQFYNEEPINAALRKLVSSKAFQGTSRKIELLLIPQTHTVVVTITFVNPTHP